MIIKPKGRSRRRKGGTARLNHDQREHFKSKLSHAPKKAIQRNIIKSMIEKKQGEQWTARREIKKYYQNIICKYITIKNIIIERK